MKRLLTVLCVVVFWCGGMAATIPDGIFFKVSGKGLKKPSYVLGSFHFVNGTHVHSIKGFDEVYQVVPQVCFETDMDRNPSVAGSHLATQSAEGAIPSKDRIFLPRDSAYSVLLGKEKAARLDSALKTIFPRFVPNLQPVYAKLAAMVLLNQRRLGLSDYSQASSFISIDYYMYAKAKTDGKIIAKLEDISVQDSILSNIKRNKLAKTPKGLKAEALDFYDFCMDFGKEARAADVTRKFYFEEKGKEMINAMLSNQSSNEMAADDMEVESRNQKWLKVMSALMEEKSTLFIVGIAHLFPYKNSPGLLNLLIDKGYQVELVNK